MMAAVQHFEGYRHIILTRGPGKGGVRFILMSILDEVMALPVLRG